MITLTDITDSIKTDSIKHVPAKAIVVSKNTKVLTGEDDDIRAYQATVRDGVVSTVTRDGAIVAIKTRTQGVTQTLTRTGERYSAVEESVNQANNLAHALDQQARGGKLSKFQVRILTKYAGTLELPELAQPIYELDLDATLATTARNAAD